MNILLLFTTTNNSLQASLDIQDMGHEVAMPNSLSSALTSIQETSPDLVVIEANNEFDSTDALAYVRQAFNGSIAAFGLFAPPATRQFFAHYGVTKIVHSFSDVIPPFTQISTAAPAA